MTNYERWQIINKNTTSPQSFIDFSFYFMIGAALQRRVWYGDNDPNTPGNLYLNSYVILTGPPGVGKGRVIIPTNSILRHWRIDIESGRLVKSSELEDPTKENYLYPVGPDNVTFEQLIAKLAKSTRRLNYEYEGMSKVYNHASMYFALEELASLMQHDTKKICELLLNAYDCGDYRRETKTQGFNQVRKPCLSFLAGTTPSWLEDNFNTRLLGDGLAARTWFVYERVNRFNLWDIKPKDDEQIKAELELLEHVRKLSECFGRIQLSPDAESFMKIWWESEDNEVFPGFPKRVNFNMKLDAYYARKITHIRKLMGMLHFMETTDSYTITLDTAKRALLIAADVEKRMHLALTFGGRNPLGSIARQVLQFAWNVGKPVTFNELMTEFNTEVREMELKEVLRFLEDGAKLRKENNKYIANYPPESNGVSTRKPKQPSPAREISRLMTELGVNGNEPIIGSDLPALPLDEGEKKE